MQVYDEIVGKRFGMLVVEGFDHFYVKPSDGKKEKRWKCVCDCGGTTITSKRKLQTGWTTSCGCKGKSRGGITKDPTNKSTYNTWNLMNQRCKNPRFTKYLEYGGRGISVCDRWDSDNKAGFDNFLEDMGLKPSDKHTIEREDVDGDYCPENCRWVADPSLQAYNQTIKKSNTSGKTGVTFDKSKKLKPWRAFIRKGDIMRKRSFSTFEEAAKKRDEWEIELYGFHRK